jgi:hypothetical protein
MTTSPKLFMIMLGCTPEGRHTEQHDIYFSIGNSINDLKQEIIDFWPEANGKIHLDAWRCVTVVDGYQIQVVEVNEQAEVQPFKLFFFNLGGYKRNEFDEFHYKMLVIAETKAAAIQQAKESAFYKHTGFTGAPSHIDDKFGVDIDDFFEIPDMLPVDLKNKYKLQISPATGLIEDEVHLGYMKLDQSFV